jgi:hypothetical protein
MTKAVDTYKQKRDIKKSYEPELDLKNPAVLKKYQGIVAESGGRSRNLQQSQSRQSRPNVYRTRSHPTRPLHDPNRPSESAWGSADNRPAPRSNLWMLLLAILLIIAIIIIAWLLLYK